MRGGRFDRQTSAGYDTRAQAELPCHSIPSAISSGSRPSAKATGRRSAAWSMVVHRAFRSSEADIQPYLDKRRPGQSRFTTQRQEPDTVKILSGVFADEATGQQVTTGTPIGAADRERRSALEGLFRHQGHLSARPCRLHLRRQIRLPRLPRRRPRLGARDGDAGGGRRHRPQDRARPQCARRADPDGIADDRSRRLGLGRGGAQSVLLSRRQGGRGLRRFSRRRAQAGLVGRRRSSR